MQKLKQYRVPVLVILVLGILVIIRSLSFDFRNDAVKWMEPSFSGKNLINKSRLNSLSGEVLILNLTPEEETFSGLNAKVLPLLPSAILEKQHQKTIHQHKGPVVLYSRDVSVAAGLWMLLSQKGCTDLYILTDSSDDEVLKQKFQPDTAIRLEH